MTPTEPHQLTIQELRNKLQALLDAGCPPDELVYTAGCDCDGKAGDVTFDAEIGSGVMIERT